MKYKSIHIKDFKDFIVSKKKKMTIKPAILNNQMDLIFNQKPPQIENLNKKKLLQTENSNKIDK